MRSLSSLVGGTGVGDDTARALAAVLDSGLVVTLRNGAGRFVDTSPVLGEALAARLRGHERLDGYRFFAADGHEIPAREHPAYIARTTGEPQRNRLVGYRVDGRPDVWLQVSFIPIERGAEGWSVLSIGTDVTPLRGRVARLETVVAARDRLIDFATAAGVRGRSWSGVAEALAPVLEDALPTANVFFGMLVAGGLQIVNVLQRFPNEFDGRLVRLSAEAASRGASGRTHVNLDVSDTDIYGDRVMAEWKNPFGSIAVVPMYRSDGEWIGSLLALEPARNGLDEDQVRLIEASARAAAVALEHARGDRAA